MSVGLAPFFRRFELPWSLEEESERKFKKLLRILLIIATLLAMLMFLLPKRETERMKPEEVRERVAQLIVEKPKPPPPPPRRRSRKRSPSPKSRSRRSRSRSRSRSPTCATRACSRMQDELAALRDQNLDLADPQMKTPVEDARSERNLITSQAGSASGGINTANMARGFGGGAGAIGTHTTTQVQHGTGLDPNAGGHVQRTGSSGKGRARAKKSRSCSIATRARCTRSMVARCAISRSLPGKLVLEFTIAPSGEITMCRVVSSELNDPELEKKIVARVRLIRFKPAISNH